MGSNINDIYAEDFQNVVEGMLTMNRSLLDVVTKQQSACAAINRAIAKAVTHCGCIQIDAKKQNFPKNADLDHIHELMDTHVKGKLCKDCRQAVEKEIGGLLFYMASLANTLDINLYDVILKEKEALLTLGNYSLR